MHGPTSHTYFSQRLRLHYVDWGNPDAPPMILIHGGRDHCRNWDWVAEQFRDDYHIIAPDLRGHGDSQWMVGGAYSQIDYVYDIAQLLRQKNMAPVTVVGHSLGGSISLLYTALHPENVNKLMAIEGMGPPPSMIAERVNQPAEKDCTTGFRICANHLVASSNATPRWRMHSNECKPRNAFLRGTSTTPDHSWQQSE